MKRLLSIVLIAMSIQQVLAEDAPAAVIVERIDAHVVYLKNVAMRHKGCEIARAASSPQELYQELDGLVSYHNAIIQNCIAQIRDQKSLQPFFDMWNTFKRDYESDQYAQASQEFLKECSDLIFMFYNNIINQVADEKRLSRVTVDEVIKIYTAISELPLGEFLDLLDRIVEQIMKILEDYQYKPGEPLFGWLQQNWWIPPVVACGLIGALLGY